MLGKEMWISVKEMLPDRDDKYLVVSDSPICRRILIASFAKNLENVDKYAFQFRGKKRPGWYEYDCDWGYIEYDNVTHWLPLPEMPEGGGHMKLDRLCTTIHSTDRLRRMILENPGLPLVVFAGEEANGGDYSWMCCTDVRVEKGEVLDCEGPNNEYIYTDRDELEDDVADQLYGEVGNLPDDELNRLLKERISRYEEYWTECIILRVTN